jgi:DNA replication protein DnaC
MKQKKAVPPRTSLPQDRRRQILEHLATLSIAMTQEELDDVLRRAEQGSWSHVELLDRLLGERAQQKRQRTVERRIREARFVMGKTLESFDWEFNAQAIDRVQIEELATGDFIARKDNLLVVGQSGVGKSHLLEGIGHRACLRGFRVRYVASDELLEKLGASLADGTTPKLVRSYASFDLLIIDGFGFDRIEREKTPRALSLLYKVIDQRNTRRSTALVTNIEFEAWSSYLGDAVLTMALMDRLADSAITLKINGKSYRAHRARRLGPPAVDERAETKPSGRKKPGGP